jgi:hypothetical protein
VLGQIEEKTSEILSKVDVLVGISINTQWETCEIEMARKASGFTKVDYWFVANALGVQGRYEAARSEVFRGSAYMVGRKQFLKETIEAKQAHDQIRLKLRQMGREQIVQESKDWYSIAFRRRLPA